MYDNGNDNDCFTPLHHIIKRQGDKNSKILINFSACYMEPLSRCIIPNGLYLAKIVEFILNLNFSYSIMNSFMYATYFYRL